MKAHYDIVVVGGSAGGLSTLKACARLYPQKSKLLIKKEEFTQIPCALPYVYEELKSSQNNIIPNGMIEMCKGDLLVGEVDNIMRESKLLWTTNGDEISYDKLVLALGSEPVVPKMEGIEKENVFFISKGGENIDKLISSVGEHKKITILGGGYIGLEFAEQIKEKSPHKELTIIEAAPRMLNASFDEEFSKEIESKLDYVGISIVKDSLAEKIVGEAKVSGVQLLNGEVIESEAVIVGIGAVAQGDLAKKVGLEVGSHNEIMVNAFQQTSDENIFSCGDCSSKFSMITHKPSGVKLASVATMEGRLVAENLYENHFTNPGVIGTYCTKVHDKVYGATGITQEQANKEGFSYVTSQVEATTRHPIELEGAEHLQLKLVFNKKNLQLLGAQASGPQEVGELINQLSLAIEKKSTLYDLYFLQPATHPKITASPIMYPIITACDQALGKLGK